MYFLIESIVPEIANKIEENLKNNKINNTIIINENFASKENISNNKIFLLQTLLAKKQLELNKDFSTNIISFSNFFYTLSKNFSFLNQKKNFSFFLDIINYLQITNPNLVILLTANKHTLNRLYKNKYNEEEINHLLELQNNLINLIEKMNIKYELINIDFSEKKIKNKILNILKKRIKKGNKNE